MITDIKKELNKKSILICDIETDSKSADKANFKYGGCYSYLTDELIVTKDIKTYKRYIDNHKYIITFNGKRFDQPILEKYGISFRNKISIDMWEILADRFPFGGKGRLCCGCRG